MSIPEVSVETLLERYRVILLDAYGVLVHSGGAMPGAVEFIRRLNASGKSYFVLTNDASKLPFTAAARYQRYGLTLEPARIITSGTLLENYFAAHDLIGARCAVLGPPDSLRYVEEAGGAIVPVDSTFEVLVIADESGFPFLETVDAAFTSLCQSLDGGQDVHLVLPNPDLIYPTGAHAFGFAAGTIATMFEGALRVRYPQRDDLRFARLGKPHEALFAETLRRSGTRNMVMIGDQLETDIRGARAFGLDAAWITTGVTDATLTDMPPALRPTYVLRSLR